MTDSGPKLVPIQGATGQEKCVIDYLSFTVDESILRRIAPDAAPFSDDEYCQTWAEYCRAALLRIECKIKQARSGLFGFDVAYRIGDFAMVMAGGKHSCLYVQFSGHAFACADEEFPQRLFQFLKASRSANITRIDIAFDDFAGEIFPVREMPDKWRNGEFSQPRSPRPPKMQRVGDWELDDIDRLGLTFYVGTRKAGRWLRIYEKGRQLGDKFSPWVRAELEFHGDTFHLIPEMLIHPTSYYVMSYPALAAVEYAGALNRVERLAREGVDTVEKVLAVIRHQYGGHLHVLRNEFFALDDKQLLETLCRVPKETPLPLRKAINLSNALDTAKPVQTPMAILEKE